VVQALEVALPPAVLLVAVRHQEDRALILEQVQWGWDQSELNWLMG
jgi:hypothetical protein